MDNCYAPYLHSGKGSEDAKLFTEDGFFSIRLAHPVNPDFAQVRNSLTRRDDIQQLVVAAATSEVHVCSQVHNLMIDGQGASTQTHCVMEVRA